MPRGPVTQGSSTRVRPARAVRGVGTAFVAGGLAAGGLVGGTGCLYCFGDGDITSEHRTLEAVRRVEVHGPLHVDVRATDGDAQATVTCDRDLIHTIRTRVEDGVLSVRFREQASEVLFVQHCSVRVDAPAVAHVVLHGEGSLDVHAAGVLNPLERVENHGSGMVRASDLRGHLTVLNHGSGWLELSGDVPTAGLTNTGSGVVWATALSTRALVVENRGSGEVYASASEEATVTLSGSGDVVITGDAPIMQQATGSGRVRREGS